MDVETEQVSEHTDTPAAPIEDAAPEMKNRDRGVKGRGRGGRMGRGGRGGRGMMKAFGPHGRGRGRGHDSSVNGFGPMRRGMGRMRPYPDLRGRGGYERGAKRHGSPSSSSPTITPEALSPMPRHGPPPPPLGPPCFRGRPPPPRSPNGPSGPPRHFHPRGYHNGPAPSPPHPRMAGVSGGQAHRGVDVFKRGSGLN